MYPILIHFLPGKAPDLTFIFPQGTKVYIIIPFYNEEKVVKEKIENCLKLKCDFKIQIYAISDNSSDKTNLILERLAKENSQVNFFNKDKRSGKNESLNIAVSKINPAESDILLFTDANTFFSSKDLISLIEKLKMGSVLVGGSMMYFDAITKSAKSEGLYWKYEEWIRRSESKRGNLIVVNGGLFVIRAKFYKKLPPYVPNDFENALRLVNSENVTFSENSIGIEQAVQIGKEEFQRKKRMANRQMNCILYLWNNLSLKIRLIVMLHKISRWYGLHLFFLQSILSFIFFFISVEIEFIKIIVTFNLVSLLLILLSLIFKKVPILSTINHGVMVHLYSFQGATNAILKKKVSYWERAESNR